MNSAASSSATPASRPEPDTYLLPAALRLLVLLLATLASACPLSIERADPALDAARDRGLVDGATPLPEQVTRRDAAPDRDRSGADLGDAGPDQAQPPTRCDWTGSFRLSEPEALTELATVADEVEPYLTEDGLVLFFARRPSITSSDVDLYVATRSGRDGPFANARPQTQLNTIGLESRFLVSQDGLTAYLGAPEAWPDPPATGQNPDLWLGRRTNTQVPFFPDDFVPLTALNTSEPDYDPFPSADGLRLYYVSLNVHDGLGGQDLLVAQRSSTAELFSAPQLIPNVNGPAHEDNPAVTADEQVLIFSSTRPGGPGTKDIYYAVRASPEVPFGAPRLVPDVNSAAAEAEAYISPDGCQVIFSSSRAGGKGGLDLYQSQYQPTPEQ